MFKEYKCSKGAICTLAKPCHNCYMRRYSSTPKAIEKKKEVYKKYYANPEIKEACIRRAKTPERKDYNRSYSKTPEGRKSQKKKRETPKGKSYMKMRNSLDKVKEMKRRYKKSPAGKAQARSDAMKRYAKRLKRMPKWANKEKIKEIYMNCPKNHEVDHILPLRGKEVSGLHIANNLQYLKRTDNQKKSNKFDGTQDNESWRNE